VYNKYKNVIKKKRVIKNLIWDDGNVAHIAKHDVLPSEVEEALEINRVEWEAYKERIFIVGPTKTGRMLTVILEPKEGAGIYKPITAYDVGCLKVASRAQFSCPGFGPR
jgi:hypothetical protein